MANKSPTAQALLQEIYKRFHVPSAVHATSKTRIAKTKISKSSVSSADAEVLYTGSFNARKRTRVSSIN